MLPQLPFIDLSSVNLRPFIPSLLSLPVAMIGFANSQNSFPLSGLPLHAMQVRHGPTGGDSADTGGDHSSGLGNPGLGSSGFGRGGAGAEGEGGVSLKTLFHGLAVEDFFGDKSVGVSCIITDSRRVVPGALFVALEGLHTSGSLYVEEAIDRGAAAIVSELPRSNRLNVPYIQVKDARVALAEVARRFFGQPDAPLGLIGITGTNGKTTVSMLTQFLLAKEPGQVGLIGTVRYDMGRRTLPSYKTTPESVDIYAMLAQMCAEGCKGAVMEVSSHAIDQKRVHGLRFSAVAFLNLTQDHIDYHHSMREYFEVKSRLFNGGTGSMPQVAVINLDDACGRRLAAALAGKSQVITFGRSEDADLRASDIRLGADGSRFTLHYGDFTGVVRTRELGHYNVSNVLASLALCVSQGRELEPLLAKIYDFPGVPGRMERVEAGQPFRVLVDYAHTEDALRNALTMLREVTPGRLYVVFGCGGNRDRSKRPLMTATVQELADVSWATADNPRREELQTIFDDMKAGVTRPQAIHFVEDRRRALSLALDAAGEGDCVLIAGKGHETYQEFADTVVPFDDRQVVRELLGLKRLRHGQD